VNHEEETKMIKKRRESARKQTVSYISKNPDNAKVRRKNNFSFLENCVTTWQTTATGW